MFRIQGTEYLLNDQVVPLENAISEKYLLRGFKEVVVLEGRGLRCLNQ